MTKRSSDHMIIKLWCERAARDGEVVAGLLELCRQTLDHVAIARRPAAIIPGGPYLPVLSHIGPLGLCSCCAPAICASEHPQLSLHTYSHALPTAWPDVGGCECGGEDSRKENESASYVNEDY